MSVSVEHSIIVEYISQRIIKKIINNVTYLYKTLYKDDRYILCDKEIREYLKNIQVLIKNLDNTNNRKALQLKDIMNKTTRCFAAVSSRLDKYLEKDRKKALLSVAQIYYERTDLKDFRLCLVTNILLYFNTKYTNIKFTAKDDVEAKSTIFEYYLL